MISYEEIKIWCKEKENQNKLVIAAGFVVIFFVGFGAGRYERGVRRDFYKPQANYTTNFQKKTEAPASKTADQLSGQGTAPGTATTASTVCKIKGNISAKGDKVYHIPGGAFYQRTKAEQCFDTESAAASAGFRKSGR